MLVCRVMVVLTSGSTAGGMLVVLSGQKLTCEQPVTKVVHLSVAAAVKDACCTDLFEGFHGSNLVWAAVCCVSELKGC